MAGHHLPLFLRGDLAGAMMMNGDLRAFITRAPTAERTRRHRLAGRLRLLRCDRLRVSRHASNAALARFPRSSFGKRTLASWVALATLTRRHFRTAVMAAPRGAGGPVGRVLKDNHQPSAPPLLVWMSVGFLRNLLSCTGEYAPPLPRRGFAFRGSHHAPP
jgi:hypothetical protein